MLRKNYETLARHILRCIDVCGFAGKLQQKLRRTLFQFETNQVQCCSDSKRVQELVIGVREDEQQDEGLGISR